MSRKLKWTGRWSLSEFLNLMELRSQTWCFVEIDDMNGFRIPHNDAVLFYAMLEGTATISGISSGPLELNTGDVVMILSGDAHIVRSNRAAVSDTLDFLDNGEYVDIPPSITLGTAAPTSRVLCGRLKVRWPGGQQPPAMPTALGMDAGQSVIDLGALEGAFRKSGAAAILTRAATLLFTVAFCGHPQSEVIFRDSTLHDPIARALQLIHTHPFTGWTVARLARKVAMGRSNFASRFVEYVGRTPIEVVTEQRMKLAATLLETSDLKIAEISERSGYRSEAAFSRRFTTYYGMSPGRMRKEWRRTPRDISMAAADAPTLR